MTHNPFTERPLSDAEVQERRMMLEHFLDEQDDLTVAVAEKKREIKETNVAIERVTARVRQLRHEIRNRMVLDAAPAPQQSLPGTEAFVVTSSDGTRATVTPVAARPAAATPAPPVDHYARWREMYPPCPDGADLYCELQVVLTQEQYDKLPIDCPWHPESGIFDAISNWARIERAHRDDQADAAAGNLPVAGLTIPARVPMPEKLAELVNPPSKKRTRGLTNRQRRV